MKARWPQKTNAAVSERAATGELLDEARQLYEMGCRYYHYHARNPLTQEQTTDNDIYQAVSR
ncbi:hypothetical protein R4J71_29355, partial [Pseudomonas aeruginosa]|uniref:hypothetical protein n=1 Tax=Pseudomonas aeruginosa TaxID=287 RepID=UPI0029540DA4